MVALGGEGDEPTPMRDDVAMFGERLSAEWITVAIFVVRASTECFGTTCTCEIRAALNSSSILPIGSTLPVDEQLGTNCTFCFAKRKVLGNIS